MKISILTVFPELYDQFLATSLIARARENNLIEFNLVQFSSLCSPKERIDEPTCGPGAGMIIKPEVMQAGINACEKKFGPGFKIFFSPQGKVLTQPLLERLASLLLKNEGVTFAPDTVLPPSLANQPRPGAFMTPQQSTQIPEHLILICPRYEGIDARVEAYYADAVFSIGDYVLMGGDLPAQVFLEGLLRLIPTIVGNKESVTNESFSHSLLDRPEYGLPKEWNGMAVPEIIFSGNHAKIAAWRNEQACKATVLNRFDWFTSSNPDKKTLKECVTHIPNHYLVLMHDQVMLKEGTVGTTSVTSLDLHDAARAGMTYGIKNCFMVTPLIDQLKIIGDLTDFWKSEAGRLYNESRYSAVSRVESEKSLDDVIARIEKREGAQPLLIATSAKDQAHPAKITYCDQGKIWREKRPVLFVFGTGQGLCNAVVDRCEFLLTPVNGITPYNHLSVRAAIAIILDRWLGLNPKNTPNLTE